MLLLEKFKKLSFIKIFNSLLIIELFFIFSSELVRGYSKDCWQITEWLINYQGGFVRRGLSGEILLWLYKNFNLSPYWVIIGICLIAYVVFLYFYIKFFIKKGLNLQILPFVFFLGAPIINDFWVRKDVILVLFFLMLIKFSLKKKKKYLILLNIFFMVAILIHESIGFFALPILFLIVNYSKKKLFKDRIKGVFISLFKLSPAIIVFGLCLFYKGNLQISKRIWESWSKVSFPYGLIYSETVPAAIDRLSWTLKEGASLSFGLLNNVNDGLYAPLVWLLIIFLVYYFLLNYHRINLTYQDKLLVSNVLIFQLITIIPLFIIGWDFGRWIFFWSTSSFAIYIFIPKHKLKFIFPNFVSRISKKIITYLKLNVRPINVLYLILFLGVPLCGWKMSVYYQTTPIYLVMKLISSFLYKLFILVY